MYSYLDNRYKLWTDEGQRDFLQVRDNVAKLLHEAGAFMMCYAWGDVPGDSFELLMYVDRLVELGEIREITGKGVAGQCRVFVGCK